jgi:xanthine/uracil permease
MHEHSFTYTLFNGLLGMSASVLAVITSFQEQLEYSVRMTGALIGCVVGAITLYNLLNKKKKQ